MKIMQKAFVTLLFFYFALLASCTKKPGLAPHPVIDPNALLTWDAPADSVYIVNTGNLQITAKVSGDQDNYSFLTAYFLNADTRDTLKTGVVNADGTINITWTNTLVPGNYPITIIAVDPAHRDVPLTTYPRRLFVCKPPPLHITEFIKDEKSITVKWEKATINNFKAYEVLVARQDTMRDRGPFPPGEVIAIITDINTTSFKHNDVYFFYKYYYVIRLITSEDCEADSENKGMEAGVSMDLPNIRTADVLFDKVKNRMYFINKTENSKPVFTVLDPELLVVEKTVTLDINDEIVFRGLNESGLSLNIVAKTGMKSFQLYSFDLNSDQLSLQEAFELPVNGAVKGLFGKKALYQSFTATTPVESQLSLFDITTTNSAFLQRVNVRAAEAIDNNSKFVVTDYNDSFFVYTMNAGVAQFTVDGYSQNLGYYSDRGVFTGGDKIAIGGNLYDQSFDILLSLQGDKFFIGLSGDGVYAVTSDNEIYDVSSSDMQLVKKYGDGFGTFPYFSSNNSVMYHLTEGSLNPKWNPSPRLFRYAL